MLRKLQIWRDRRGNLSWLRLAALAFLLLPVGIALWNADAIVHGARPLNDVIHRAGFWMLMFILTTLAITPLRRITRFGQLIDVRRMLGVGAFAYGVAHISLYTADQMFDLVKVASEIAQRVYLIIGFTALLGLATLASTSTDAMVRRLGALRWQRLHYAVYGIGIAIVFNAPPLLVLQANLDFDVDLDMIRPGWLVLAAGLAVAALNFVCARLVKPRGKRVAPSRNRTPQPEPKRALASAN